MSEGDAGKMSMSDNITWHPLSYCSTGGEPGGGGWVPVIGLSG